MGSQVSGMHTHPSFMHKLPRLEEDVASDSGIWINFVTITTPLVLGTWPWETGMEAKLKAFWWHANAPYPEPYNNKLDPVFQAVDIQFCFIGSSNGSSYSSDSSPPTEATDRPEWHRSQTMEPHPSPNHTPHQTTPLTRPGNMHTTLVGLLMHTGETGRID